MIYHFHEIFNFSGDDDGEAWLDEAAQAIVDIFRLNENSDIEQQQQPMEIDSNNESQHHNRKKAGNSNRKVSSVWIIPYLVRNLKFLQSKVLKVSSEILEGGNWSKAGGNIDFTIFFKKSFIKKITSFSTFKEELELKVEHDLLDHMVELLVAKI